MSSEQNGDDSRGRPKPAAKIPRLKGRPNYLEWAQAVEIHFKAMQCWGIVTGKLHRPAEPTYSPYTKPISAAKLREREPDPVLTAPSAALRLTVIDAEIKRWEAWESKHKYAVEQMYKTVERSIWDRLKFQTDAPKLWIELREAYQQAKVPEFMEELVKFHAIKPNAFNSTERYGEAVRASYLRLVNTLKFPFPKEHVAFKILQELKGPFKIKLAKYDSAAVFPDFEQIIEDCVSHERQYGVIGSKKPTATPVQTASVQVVSTSEEQTKKRKANANKTNRDPPPKCSECGNEHYLNKNSVCFYKHPDKAPPGWKQAKRFMQLSPNQN